MQETEDSDNEDNSVLLGNPKTRTILHSLCMYCIDIEHAHLYP